MSVVQHVQSRSAQLSRKLKHRQSLSFQRKNSSGRKNVAKGLRYLRGRAKKYN